MWACACVHTCLGVCMCISVHAFICVCESSRNKEKGVVEYYWRAGVDHSKGPWSVTRRRQEKR